MTESVRKIDEGVSGIEKALLPNTNRIFHYTSPNGLLGILKDGGKAKLFFTQYDSLNDKSERVHAEEWIRKVCRECLQKKKITQEFFDIVQKCLEPQKVLVTYPSSQNPEWVSHKMLMCDTYLCCFSKNSDSLSMWNYYSKSNRYEGYNIGFYIEKEVRDWMQGYRLAMVKVIYDDLEKIELIKNLVIPICEKFEKYKQKGEKYDWLIAELQSGIDDIILAFKNRHFAHEEEIRLILRMPVDCRENGHDNISERKYRESKGNIVPYVEYTFKEDKVYEIHIAPLLESEMTQQNIYDLLKQRGYPHVHVFPSEIPIRF